MWQIYSEVVGCIHDVFRNIYFFLVMFFLLFFRRIQVSMFNFDCFIEFLFFKLLMILLPNFWLSFYHISIFNAKISFDSLLCCVSICVCFLKYLCGIYFIFCFYIWMHFKLRFFLLGDFTFIALLVDLLFGVISFKVILSFFRIGYEMVCFFSLNHC